MTSHKTIAVVGTSLAGLRGIEALRREGFEGKIIAIGDEPHRPYDRPPLSKQFLKGDFDEERLTLRHDVADDDGVEWRLGVRATGLDLGKKRVTLSDGEGVEYDGLFIATGARPRRFPGAEDRKGVHVLRTLEDATNLRDTLAGSPRVAVIGAGFIGMEVAATCRERGLEVSVVEALPTPLVRGLGTVLGEHVAGVFRERGVDIRCGVGVRGFKGDGRVEAVELEDGSSVLADVVVVGIGAFPITDWLEGSGLRLENGLLCDSTCAALGASDIVAAGDVARWLDANTAEYQRAEHWTNAVEQGSHAARRLVKGPEAGPYQSVPYVWTDQFDLRIQMAGEVGPDDEMQIRHGSLAEGRCVALFGRKGKLSAAVAFRRPRQLHEYRDLIAEGATFQRALAHASA